MVSPGSYTVTTTAYINLSPVNSIAPTPVSVASCCPVTASYTSSATVGCTDDTAPITFTSTSTSATSNNWYVNGVLSFSGTSFYTPVPPVGTYNVKLVSSDGSCSDSITQTYQVYNSPNLVLGPDTIGCSGTPIVLSAPTGFSSYAWTNNTSTTSNASVTTANTYKATVTDANGCTASDSIVVGFYALPAVSLGNDTAICAGQTLTLDAGTFSSYLWNNSATTQTIDVTTSFNYTVTVTDANGCQKTDAIGVFVNALPTVNLGPDTFEICAGGNVNINAGTPGTYLWSTSETTNLINVSNQGPVTLTVTNANGCQNSDNTYVKVNALPIVDFGADTLSFCAGGSVSLNPGMFNSYAWSTSATSSTISVSTAGDYNVSVTNAKGCANSGSVNVKENALPLVSLGEDQELCKTDKLTLSAGLFDSYLWNDGSAAATLEVNGVDYSLGTNTFNVTVTDTNTCSGSDEVVITVKECNVGISSTQIEKSISVYPIPSSSVLNIQSELNEVANIKVFNILGKEVMNRREINLDSNSSLNISKLVNGVYFLQITVGNEKMIKQFVKIN